MIFNKKGSANVLGPVIVFIILNLLFFGMLLYFVVKQSTGAGVYEELYAKKIALLVDGARCNSEIAMDISNLDDVLEKNNYELEDVFRLNSNNNEVVVRVSSRGGYAYKHFSDCELNFEIVGSDLILKIGKAKNDPTEMTAYDKASDIILFEGSSAFKQISNCEENLDQRKIDLEIPDKLCYWEAMTELYDEKCENLDSAEISEIFEKKAEYRELNNPGWPNLNVDGDFCVSVIYDCGEWEKNAKSTGSFGFVKLDDPQNRIWINPSIDFLKEFVEEILLHEGLHSIQETSSFNNIFGFFSSKQVLESLDSEDKNFGEIYDRRDLLIKDIESLIKELMKGERLKCLEFSGTEKGMECFEKYGNNAKPLSRYRSKLGRSTAPIDFKDYIFENNPYYNKLVSNKEYEEKVSALNEFLLGEEFNHLVGLITAGSYVAKNAEIDPRLSEVARWWLDETSPNCEIIDTSEKAGNVLDAFLMEDDLPNDHKLTQEQLSNLMEIAEIQGSADEIYAKLITRLPGLASLDDTENNGEVYA